MIARRGLIVAGRRRLRSITLVVSAATIVCSLAATAGAGVDRRVAPAASVILADVKASLSTTTLPTELSPPLASATTDTALVDTPSLSRCNTTSGGVALSKCVFGDRSGTHTMVLWGDSHAFMWFPAVNAVAKAAHWKLVTEMMFGCPVADVSVWNGLTHTAYTRCDEFRSKMIAAVNKLRPSLVVLTESFTAYAASGHGANNTISIAQWQAALAKTLRLLHANKMKKVVLGSTIATGGVSPPECLAANPSAVQACTVSDTPEQAAQRAAEQAAAKSASVPYVNVLPWLCSSAVTPLACSAVIGDATNGYKVVYYAAGHLTETYDLFLQGVLAASLKPSMR